MKWAERRQRVIDIRGRSCSKRFCVLSSVEHRLKDAILDSELPERPDTRLVMDWSRETVHGPLAFTVARVY